MSKKTLLMNNTSKLKAREQAEAYLRQIRSIPHAEALLVMENLLAEIQMLREVHYSDHDTPRLTKVFTIV